MKIDLHCHTQATKEGDGPGRIVSPVVFAEKMELAEVKIAAITNHNSFVIDHYEALVACSTGICQVWPGIELDMAGIDNDWHLLLVCNPKEALRFAEAIDELLGTAPPDDIKLSIERVVATCKSLDLLYIPPCSRQKERSRKT